MTRIVRKDTITRHTRKTPKAALGGLVKLRSKNGQHVKIQSRLVACSTYHSEANGTLVEPYYGAGFLHSNVYSKFSWKKKVQIDHKTDAPIIADNLTWLRRYHQTDVAVLDFDSFSFRISEFADLLRCVQLAEEATLFFTYGTQPFEFKSPTRASWLVYGGSTEEKIKPRTDDFIYMPRKAVRDMLDDFKLAEDSFAVYQYTFTTVYFAVHVRTIH